MVPRKVFFFHPADVVGIPTGKASVLASSHQPLHNQLARSAVWGGEKGGQPLFTCPIPTEPQRMPANRSMESPNHSKGRKWAGQLERQFGKSSLSAEVGTVLRNRKNEDREPLRLALGCARRLRKGTDFRCRRFGFFRPVNQCLPADPCSRPCGWLPARPWCGWIC